MLLSLILNHPWEYFRNAKVLQNVDGKCSKKQPVVECILKFYIKDAKFSKKVFKQLSCVITLVCKTHIS